MQTEYATIIRCKPEQLWDWLEAPEKQKQWMTGLQVNRRTNEGPLRVGATFRLTIREGRRHREYDGEIINYIPYRHLGVRYWGGALHGVELTMDYKLQYLGDRTRLDYVATADATHASFFMKALLPFVTLFSGIQVKRLLATLKHLAETEAVQESVIA